MTDSSGTVYEPTQVQPSVKVHIQESPVNQANKIPVLSESTLSEDSGLSIS